jgi:hypothetical protein|tara:strand:+ start:2257 stop:2628 length:372 start_codon:yes stop_codon:yes gene_type:complete
MKKKAKKPKEKKLFKVYVTYFPDGRYYIGFSQKSEKLYLKYYGSSKEVMEYDKDLLQKDTIVVYEHKNKAKMQEFLLQWQNRHDPNCINDMLNIRLRSKYLNDFIPVRWRPREVLQLELFDRN